MATRKTWSPIWYIGAHADRPAATVGQVGWISEDTTESFRSDGAAWVPLGPASNYDGGVASSVYGGAIVIDGGNS